MRHHPFDRRSQPGRCQGHIKDAIALINRRVETAKTAREIGTTTRLNTTHDRQFSLGGVGRRAGRLRFEISDADLYSYRFVENSH